MTKAVVRVGIAVMTTLLIMVILWNFRIVVIYVFVSLMLAATLRPIVKRLIGQSLIQRLLWILMYIASLGSIIVLLFLVGKTAISETRLIFQIVSNQNEWVFPKWLEYSPFQKTLVNWLPSPGSILFALIGSKGEYVLPAIFNFTQGLGGGISKILFTLFLSIYWSISQIHFERLWLSLLPSDRRKEARGIWRIIEPDIGAYIRSQIILGFLTGLLIGIGNWLLGSPYPILLGLAGATTSMIPVFGIIIMAIVALTIGLQTSVQLSIFSVLFAFFVFIVLRIWVKPRLFNRGWDNPILTVILLMILADAFGIVGIIVAPVLSVLLQIIWSNLVSHRVAMGAASQISDLILRQEQLWAVINSMDEVPPPLVKSSMERLSALIENAEPILKKIPSAELSEVITKS